MARSKILKNYGNGISLTQAGTYWWRTRSASGTCATYDEARSAKRKAEERGKTSKTGRGEFGAYALDWVERYGGRTRRGFGDASRQRYRESLTLYAVPFFDEVRKRRLAAIRRVDAEAFVRWLEDRDDPILSTATIERTMAPVSIMLNDAMDNEVIPFGPNPFKGISPNPRREVVDLDEPDDNRKRPFTEAELATVMDTAARADRGELEKVAKVDGGIELLLHTLGDTGIRIGELIMVQKRSLKTGPHGPYLAIRRAWDDKGDNGPDKPKGKPGRPKRGKPRDIPLSPELARGLWALPRADTDFLFRAPQGGRLRYHNTLRRTLWPLLEAASQPAENEEPRSDVTWAGFHTFRHTYVTLAYDHGVNPKRISQNVGHHKLSYTLDAYNHLNPDGSASVFSAVAAARAAEDALGNNTGNNSQAETPRKGADGAEHAIGAKVADLRAKRPA